MATVMLHEPITYVPPEPVGLDTHIAFTTILPGLCDADYLRHEIGRYRYRLGVLTGVITEA